MEKVKITKICQCCDRSFDFFLTVEQIISGICGECFDKIFLDSGEE